MMFTKDPEVVADFMRLRILLVVTFLGLGLIWVAFFAWVFWRMGPGGYSAEDANADRKNICILIEQLHPRHGKLCPEVLKAK